MMGIMRVVSGLMVALNGFFVLLAGLMLFDRTGGGEAESPLAVLLVMGLPLANLFFSLQFNGGRPRFLWAGFWLNAGLLFTYLNFYFLADYSARDYWTIRSTFKTVVIYLLIHLSYAPVLRRYQRG